MHAVRGADLSKQEICCFFTSTYRRTRIGCRSTWVDTQILGMVSWGPDLGPVRKDIGTCGRLVCSRCREYTPLSGVLSCCPQPNLRWWTSQAVWCYRGENRKSEKTVANKRQQGGWHPQNYNSNQPSHATDKEIWDSYLKRIKNVPTGCPDNRLATSLVLISPWNQGCIRMTRIWKDKKK